MKKILEKYLKEFEKDTGYNLQLRGERSRLFFLAGFVAGMDYEINEGTKSLKRQSVKMLKAIKEIREMDKKR